MTGYCACGRPVENRDTVLCATCSKAGRTPVKVKKAPRPIHKVSKKMADQLKEYTRAKAEHLKEHPDCQARLKEICRNDRRSNTIHHTAKRDWTHPSTFGKYFFNFCKHSCLVVMLRSSCCFIRSHLLHRVWRLFVSNSNSENNLRGRMWSQVYPSPPHCEQKGFVPLWYLLIFLQIVES